MKSILILTMVFSLVACKDQVSNSGEESNTVNTTSPISACAKKDNKVPIMQGALNIKEDGSTKAAPTLEWDGAKDNCQVSHYEYAIGTSPGGEEVMGFHKVEGSTHQAGGLNLTYSQNYYFSLRAVDESGNTSAPVVSDSWQIFTPQTLTNLVLWLDASNNDSISDAEGDHPGDGTFSNEISTWGDISGSSAIHSFNASGVSRPNWDVTSGAVRFNGSSQFMATADHADINLATNAQRTLTVAFKTDDDVNTRQLVFEEGGGVRGINIYIESGLVRCGFWNDTNDGDETQGFIETSSPIATNENYVVSLLFDYSNYTSPGGADGTVSCIVNDVNAGSVNTTSRLFAHSGDIGLGAVNQHTVYASGINSGSNIDHFKGVIYELLMYNSAHSEENLIKLHNVLNNKWKN